MTKARPFIAVGLGLWLVPTYGLFCLHLKVLPLALLLSLFLIHAVAQLGKVGWLETAARSVILSIGGGAAAATSGYLLAIWIAPSRTSDGHPVMPIGQALLGLAAGVLVGVTLLVLYLRRWRREPARRTVGKLVNLAGAVTLGVAASVILRSLS